MESRVIELTPAAHKHGNLNIKPCGTEFFPPNVFGGSSEKDDPGVPIILHVDGLSAPVETDIPKSKKTGKPRWIFRKRKWIKDFVQYHKLQPGYKVTISRLDERTYKVSPNNHNKETHEQMHMKKKNKKPITSTHASETRKKHLDISYKRTCECKENHINCLTAKEWIKNQIGVWQFYYEGRDIRDKNLHPATFPISLARKCIELFTHKGELVLDPFVGSGTTLLAARDTNRNAVGFDLNKQYVKLCNNRLAQQIAFNEAKQIPICDDARNMKHYLEEGTIKLMVTSPPYANLLNRKRKNKSRRGAQRKNGQYGKIEQYSQDKRDLGILSLENYSKEISLIYKDLLPFLHTKGHCIINVADMWWENERIPIHIAIIKALEEAGYKLRNTIIWDRTNIVNRVGIFGWPSNYITMGTTFEYLLHFIRNEV